MREQLDVHHHRRDSSPVAAPAAIPLGNSARASLLRKAALSGTVRPGPARTGLSRPSGDAAAAPAATPLRGGGDGGGDSGERGEWGRAEWGDGDAGVLCCTELPLSHTIVEATKPPPLGDFATETL